MKSTASHTAKRKTAVVVQEAPESVPEVEIQDGAAKSKQSDVWVSSKQGSNPASTVEQGVVRATQSLIFGNTLFHNTLFHSRISQASNRHMQYFTAILQHVHHHASLAVLTPTRVPISRGSFQMKVHGSRRLSPRANHSAAMLTSSSTPKPRSSDAPRQSV